MGSNLPRAGHRCPRERYFTDTPNSRIHKWSMGGVTCQRFLKTRDGLMGCFSIRGVIYWHVPVAADSSFPLIVKKWPLFWLTNMMERHLTAPTISSCTRVAAFISPIRDTAIGTTYLRTESMSIISLQTTGKSFGSSTIWWGPTV